MFFEASVCVRLLFLLRFFPVYIASVTAEKWVPIIEVPVNSVKNFLERKKREGFSILGLEQTANSIPLDKYSFPHRTVNVCQLRQRYVILYYGLRKFRP